MNQAAKAIIAGEGDVYIGGGVESMSRAPWAMAKPASVPTNRAPKVWDTTVGWRFNNPRMDELYPIVSLGETAENVAEQMQITREEQDRFALGEPAPRRRRHQRGSLQRRDDPDPGAPTTWRPDRLRGR